MRVLALTVLALMTMHSFLVPAAMAPPIPAYESAIQNAVVTSTIDRRPELQRCLTMWQAHELQRPEILSSFLESVRDNERHALLVEIGNSGFPRYDYILVRGNELKSSLGGTESTRIGAVLGRRLLAIQEVDVRKLAGNAFSIEDDGDCYFLTIRVGNEAQRLAVYGGVESATPVDLVNELLTILKL